MLERLRPDHATELLAFERENRSYFAESVPDRGDDYFNHFEAQHRALLAEQEAGTCHFHLVVVDGEILGRVNLVDVADGAAELGFRIAEKATGRGLATSAVREASTLAATTYGLTRLRAAAANDNIASRTVLTRTGFEPTGEETLLDGKPGQWYELKLDARSRRVDHPMLVVVGGLPATGKTTVSRTVAGKAGGTHVRIDTIEQAIVRFAVPDSSGDEVRHAVNWGLGYEVAYAVAKDLLTQGTHVFAECVNPMKITRDAWRDVATTTGALLFEVELVCSDPAEHERRATSRVVDIPDLALPTWADIVNREYEPWDRPHVVLDTAGKSPEDTAAELCAVLGIDT